MNPTAPAGDPTSLFQQLFAFIQTGHGTAAVGVVLMLLVYGLRAGLATWVSPWFKTQTGGYVLGFGTATLAYFGAALLSLQSYHAISLSLVINALGAGFLAAGGWEALRDILTKIGKPPTSATLAAIVLCTFVALAGSGCGAQAQKMTGSFATCAKADLGQIVSDQGQNLPQYLADLVAKNAADLEQKLSDLLKQVGLDALECAFAAVESVLSPTPNAPSPNVGVPGLDRARTWLRAQKAKSAMLHAPPGVASSRLAAAAAP